ncbi:MAG TPA: 16S rRNA (cytosine(967)-C(5))-methyltransferase RsmB [Aromatoleum sp.]|uniref:16S rRNA (cytosine(967)-C(5))-methyltransferase RsmB n=1 Tax=Aromatoleum sp. TaxID=2307007 RepID=UPI002B47CD06|nr:16S rRNA (cytosine(967)-C(5))-methyltransferase RsmB [Aromatoleum sp.]HJV28358.1 16S rRNA (cytosine(967)-C(5))-methyltransferase RsmB [Aromatoleum sp.]
MLPIDSLGYSLARAAELVAAVLEGANLTDAWERALKANPGWPDATRGAVRDLAWSCLRAYGRGDAVLRDLLHKPLPTELHALLLVALNRLESHPQQAHTVVDQTVDAAASLIPALKGVINGVLRNCLRNRDAFAATVEADLAARYRHPAWWIRRLQQSFPDRWEAALAGGNMHPPMALRVNRQRADVPSTTAALREAGLSLRELDNGALVLDTPVAVTALPGFAEGRLSVQDAGAQWAAPWLGLEAGQRVLDACAAPGGKSAHILETAPVELLALELDPMRTQRIRDNFARLGLAAPVRTADCRDVEAWWDGRPFDRILADVPCSASGVARRHPDIKWLRRPEDIRRFAAQQADILDALWPTLARGGRMLYVTCSVFDDENSRQIAAFCARHDDARRIDIDGQPDRQFLPNADHDGFYYALVEKAA